MTTRLGDRLTGQVPHAPLDGESLEAFRHRLSELGVQVRLLSLAGPAALADLGPEAGEAGLAYIGKARAHDGNESVVDLWSCWGFERPTVNLQIAPALAQVSTSLPEAAKGDVSDDLTVRKLLSDIAYADTTLVEHAVTPLSFRIYPDTPISEVVELMLRRNIDAVPVVGGDHEVLGVITAGDILPHRVPDGELAREAPPEALTARDLMTRSVLCVTEEQSLAEASRAMVNRGVEQLPIVREGELVGFLERRTVLRAFADRVDLGNRPTPDEGP
ncbi:MAG: CBS domain-containing protein [Longimicrobiales bacterium]